MNSASESKDPTPGRRGLFPQLAAVESFFWKVGSGMRGASQHRQVAKPQNIKAMKEGATLRGNLRRSLATLALLFMVAGAFYYYFFLLVPQTLAVNSARDLRGHAYRLGGDFYQVWLAGRQLADGTNPYSEGATRQLYVGVYGRQLDRPRDPFPFPYAYPLYSGLLALPLAPFSFEHVRIVVAILMLGFFGWALVLWLKASGTRPRVSNVLLVFAGAAGTYPMLEGFYSEQMGIVVAIILAFVFQALLDGAFLRAGVLLALAAVKPQLVWLVVAWLVLWATSDIQKRRDFLLGFLGTMAIMMFASLALVPRWLEDWTASLTQYSSHAFPPLAFYVLGKFCGVVFAVGVLALAGWTGWRSRKALQSTAAFSFAFAFMLVVALLLTPSAGATYDQAVALPAIFWLWRRRNVISLDRKAKIIAIMLVALIGWQLVAACAVTVCSFLSITVARRPQLLVLPTRTAASIPFAIFALLALFASGRGHRSRLEAA